MKVLLFYPRVKNMVLPSYAPLGIMSIATFLNNNGHQAVIHDRFFSTEKVSTVIERCQPDIIGISVISQTFISDAMVISKETRKFKIPVIWGGCLSSAISETVLRSGNADYISINEGEFTWLDIAEAFDSGIGFESIKGLAYLKDNTYVETECRDFIDLTELPRVDWNLIAPEKYIQKTYGIERMLSVYKSKGCSGRCSFCYNPCFHKSLRRVRSVESVIDEMRFLSAEYGADGFEFTDETMFESKKEAVEFCETLVKSGLKVKWCGYLKTSVMHTVEDFEIMYNAGCRMIMFGVESGSKNVLKSMHKPNDLKTITDTINSCAEAGIVPLTTFIIGFPGETVQDLKETVALAKSLKGALVTMFYFTPLPGAELYEKLVDENRVLGSRTLEDYGNVIELERMYKNFSKVPMRELRAVKEFFRLRSFLESTGPSKDEQMLKVIISTVKTWTGRGTLSFFAGLFKTLKKVIGVITVFINPFIRKKYGLYFRK